jgi:biotin carboxyl carrier protein
MAPSTRLTNRARSNPWVGSPSSAAELGRRPRGAVSLSSDAPCRAGVDNRSFEIEVDNTDDDYRVLVDGRNYHVNLVDERRVRVGGAQGGLELQGRQKVVVPMPGKIIAVLVSEGDQVEKGQGLVIVEAMKMENEVHSPIAGEVKEIKVKPGDTVEGGALMLVVE